MNREIKFRVWTGKELVNWDKVWHTEVQLPENFGKDIFLPILSAAFLARGNNGLIASQFTGLKDKNGQEIYEGDIIRQWGLPPEPREEIITVSTWDEETCGFQLKRIKGYGFAAQKMGHEVIGNIFENPELLKNETL